MRIHLNLGPSIARATIYSAAANAGVYLERYERHGSRTHTCAVEVILSGDSPHRINSPEFGHENAASWDQWGIFLAVIYAADPSARSWAYSSDEDFHRQTGGRFNPGYPGHVDSQRHPEYRRTSHRWEADTAPEGTPWAERTWHCKGHGKANPTCTATLGPR